MSRSGDRLVWSSERGGGLCPRCARPLHRGACEKTSASATSATGDGIVRVRRERKGRKGKTVTTVTGLPLAPDELSQLAGELKRRCGSGGAVKAGVIEIQGDHCDGVVAELESRGYQVKRAGG